MEHDANISGDPTAAAWAFEHHPQPVILFRAGSLDIAAINAAARTLLSAHSAVGRPARTALPGLGRWELFDQVVRTGQPARGRGWTVSVKEPAGTREVDLDLTLHPWRDTSGEVVGVAAFGEDLMAAARESAMAAAAVEPVDLVTEMQDALLPPGVPVLPRLSIAAGYLFASPGGNAGGDWFDTVLLPDGRLALVVGDVIGHGAEASAVMARLQAVAHERLESGASPAETMITLDRFSLGQPDAPGTTLCIVVIDSWTGELEYCSAGHPPPLLVGMQGEFRYLAPSRHGPLGTRSTYNSTYDMLDPGMLLALYSDGLIERPGRPSSESTVELARIAGGAHAKQPRPGTLSEVGSKVLAQMVAQSGLDDDATLLLAQRTPPAEPLDIKIPADPAELSTVRHQLGDWLDDLGTRRLDRSAILQACHEAVSNAAQHAYDTSSTGELSVRAQLGDDGQLSVAVHDQGRWREPDPGEDGLGLMLAAGLVDQLTVQRSDQGTTVCIEHRLMRPVTLLETSDAPHRLPGAEAVAETEIHRLPGRVRVEGPLDREANERLRFALLHAGRAGTSTVTVDLSGATMLAGVAVRELFEAVRRGDEHGAEVKLIAAAGSPAQHVLELVALPYRTREF
ncbi:SpoIIE family protein phosphatase [Nocardioides pacificus]